MIYLFIFILILSDQLTKKLAVKYLMGKESIDLIGNYLKLNYVENYGAAFGIFQNKKIFLITISSFILIGIIIYFIKTKNTKITKISLALIVGGAIGNLIDRIRLGYVIDFIDVVFGKLYDYPVFNLADSFVFIGTVILIYVIFTEKSI